MYLPCAQSFLGFSLQSGWSQGPEADEPLVSNAWLLSYYMLANVFYAVIC